MQYFLTWQTNCIGLKVHGCQSIYFYINWAIICFLVFPLRVILLIIGKLRRLSKLKHIFLLTSSASKENCNCLSELGNITAHRLIDIFPEI